MRPACEWCEGGFIEIDPEGPWTTEFREIPCPECNNPKNGENEMELINKSDLTFTDISSEEHREYEFESGRVVRILSPQWVNVSESGGHRILDGEGISHYIPNGWIWLRWRARDGAAHFVK